MTGHDVHVALHKSGARTVAQLARQFACEPRAVTNRILVLRESGKVTRTGKGGKGSPYVYESAVTPQAFAPGLTDRLNDILRPRYAMRFAEASGFTINTVNAMLTGALLDKPDSVRLLSRSVAAQAARLLARRHERSAADLRAWADDCDKAVAGVEP